MLTRLIYASRATGSIEEAVIQSILESSRRFNSRFQVTGMLCEGNGRFIQYIEGNRATINELYARILGDTRHTNLVLLEYGPIENRAYENWSMGFITTQNPDVMRLIKKSTNMADFLPENMSAWQALSFIQCVKEQLYPQVVIEVPQSSDRATNKLH